MICPVLPFGFAGKPLAIRKIKLEDARAIARRRFAEVELGVDPVERLAKLKAEQKITFKSVVERYLAAKEGKVAASTLAQLKLHLQSFFKSLRQQGHNCHHAW